MGRVWVHNRRYSEDFGGDKDTSVVQKVSESSFPMGWRVGMAVNKAK